MLYLALIALVFAVYFRSLEYGYVADDDNSSAAVRRSISTKFIAKGRVRLSRIMDLFYGAGLFENKKLDHLARVTGVAIISCLIYACFHSFWIAALWAVHPINNQVALWLNGRRYQISMIFALLAYKFPIAGFLFYPLAVMFHPIAIPMIFIAGFMATDIAWLWSIPAMLNYQRLMSWLEHRFKIQKDNIYKQFNWGKPILATKCLSEYFRHGIFPTGFTMYHPEIWGIAELPGNRKRCYALNAPFWLCIAFLGIIGYIGWYIGGSCFAGLLIAFIGVLPWIGLVINPTQLWAQRYAALSSIGFIMFSLGVAEYIGYPTEGAILLFVGYTLITIKDMEMYRDLYSFFWAHYLQQPHNMQAANSGSAGFNAYADMARKDGKANLMAIYSSHSLASSLMWCFRHPKHDLIHNLANQQMQGIFKRKAPAKKEGA